MTEIVRAFGSLVLQYVVDNPRCRTVTVTDSRPAVWTPPTVIPTGLLLGVCCATISADGRALAAASRDGAVEVYTLRPVLQMLKTWDCGFHPYHVSFSPCGTCIALDSAPGEFTFVALRLADAKESVRFCFPLGSVQSREEETAKLFGTLGCGDASTVPQRQEDRASAETSTSGDQRYSPLMSGMWANVPMRRTCLRCRHRGSTPSMSPYFTLTTTPFGRRQATPAVTPLNSFSITFSRRCTAAS